WVPVLGLAWWALDFPFMGRYSRRDIARNPELGRRDMAATRRACEKFRDLPVSVMNFVEGTRFTPDKHSRQGSPYQHLLKPKSGGIAFVIDAMGDGLHAMLDITIAYPAGRPGMRELLLNQIPEIRVCLQQRPVPRELVPDNWQHDPATRARFQQWLNQLWHEKDQTMARLLAAEPASAPAIAVTADADVASGT
ncbi:MAG: acetyltransferase, partial [Lysobacterales bacterium]